MTEEFVQDSATTEETPVATESTKSPIARASGLKLILPDGTELRPIKYPMPLKAPRLEMKINGQLVEAAQTTFKAILYTYFKYQGASFYVPGHLDMEADYTLTFNEGYNFTPTKMDRKVTAAKAAVSLKAKKATASTDPQKPDEQTVQPAAAPETPAEGDATSPPAETPAEPSAEPAPPAAARGRRASR